MAQPSIPRVDNVAISNGHYSLVNVVAFFNVFNPPLDKPVALDMRQYACTSRQEYTRREMTLT